MYLVYAPPTGVTCHLGVKDHLVQRLYLHLELDRMLDLLGHFEKFPDRIILSGIDTRAVLPFIWCHPEEHPGWERTITMSNQVQMYTP